VENPQLHSIDIRYFTCLDATSGVTQKKSIDAFIYNKTNSRLRKEERKDRRMEEPGEDSRKARLLRVSREGPFEEFKKFFVPLDIKNTALMYAVKGNQIEIVKYLIRVGANMNAKNELEYTALMEASAYGHLAIVKVLIDAGANVNARSNRGDTPLMIASAKGHLDVMKALVDAGATMIVRNDDGETTFSLAHGDKRDVILEFLRSRIFGDKGLGETLRRLMHPRIPQNVVFSILLQLDYRTIKTLCAIAPFLKNVFSRFIKDICDGNLFWKEKIKKDFPTTFETLEKKERDDWRSFYSNIHKYGPTLISTVSNYLVFIKTMKKALEVGIGLEFRDEEGNTALMMASKIGKYIVVVPLVKAGADVNAKNKDGNTALMMASISGHKNVVETLIRAEANVDAMKRGDRFVGPSGTEKIEGKKVQTNGKVELFF
jgi:serine/threonine-protein phosphatase 6 regulatory ankyrin repeat subunit B